MEENNIKYKYTKTPVDYQITEYDCGTTTLLNALRYLFKSSEVRKERMEKATTRDFALVRGENSEIVIMSRF